MDSLTHKLPHDQIATNCNGADFCALLSVPIELFFNLSILARPCVTVALAKLLSFESLTILIDSVDINWLCPFFFFFFFLLDYLHTYMEFCN
jgi:hypothetical protein